MAAAPVASTIGSRIPRVEGPDRVAGRARFTADVVLPNALWAATVHSPLAHARIVSIDTAAALAVPGVRMVFTGQDVPNKEKRLGRSKYRDLPILAIDRVRYISDRVAIVAADTPEAAEEGALRVQVEYEELPAVFDPLEAMKLDAPVLHPEADRYPGRLPEIPAELNNIAGYDFIDRGDLEKGFAEADLVIEHTFRTQMSHQGYLEPNAFAVMIHEDGRVGIWASNKSPYNLRSEMAHALDLPESQIVVHPTSIGADFGGKGGQPEPAALYYIAKATGRPVKQVLSYAEDLTATAPRHPSVIRIKSGVKRDGTITARETQVIWDSGAFAAFKPSANAMLGGTKDSVGAYDIPNVKVRGYMVYTNHEPCGYMRAPGQSQGFFAAEAHMDLIARELRMDPLELRRKNITQRKNDGGEAMAPPVLEAAAKAINWGAPKPPNVGRGLSIGSRGTGSGPGSSDITVNPDGTITVITAIPDNGPGGLTTVVQTAAEVFGVPMDRVKLVQGDTESLPIDAGSGASRVTLVVTTNIRAAAEQVIQQLTPYASSMLGGMPAKWRRGGWATEDGRSVTLEEVAVEMVRPGDPAAHAQVSLQAPRAGGLGYCCQAAEVEVDPETGAVKVRKLVSAQDTGMVLNALSHQSQIEGSVIQGLGYSLTEELVIEDGRVTNAHLGDYKLPCMADVPPLETVNLPSTGVGDWNIRSIGEIVLVPTAGAIANAVMDAVGIEVTQIPITAERVLNALDARSK